jgi:ABC-type Fe3+/spermidine/putrescine transport system ATPase subunit
VTARRTDDAAPAVRVEDVSKLFGSTVAVEQLTLSVEPSTFVTLLGPSGCGKTTTLRMVAGLEEPTSGGIWIHGRDVRSFTPRDRPTSMVFQDYALFPHLNARDNVAFGLKVRGVPRVERDRRADQMLATLGLAGMGERMPRQLSGGQRQRVAMGRSLILEPRVLLLDEPLGALDAQVRRQLQVELRQLQRSLGLTFVYVTHDQEEAMALSDRIVVMNKGRIIQDGGPEDVYRHPRSTFVARFLGDCNLLEGRPTEIADGALVMDLERLGRVRVARPAEAFATDGPLTVALRPEDVSLTAAGTGRIDGRILERTFLGATTRYLIEASGLRIEAIVDQATVFEAGVTAGLAWDDANLTVVVVEAPSQP